MGTEKQETAVDCTKSAQARWGGRPPIEWLKRNWRSLVVSRTEALARAAPIYDLPGACGVYLVLVGDRVVYVGGSRNMNARGRQHESNWAANCRAVGIPVPDLFLRDLEGAYIQALAPPRNHRIPGSVGEVPILAAIERAWA